MSFIFDNGGTGNRTISGATDLLRSAALLHAIKAMLVDTTSRWVWRGGSTGDGGAFNIGGADLWTSPAAILGFGAWAILESVSLGNTPSGLAIFTPKIVLSMRAIATQEENLGYLISTQDFDGGAPSTTVLPSTTLGTDFAEAADRQLTNFNLVQGTYVAHIACDDASAAWYCFIDDGSGGMRGMTQLDHMKDPLPNDRFPFMARMEAQTGFDSDQFAIAAIGSQFQTDYATPRDRNTNTGYRLGDVFVGGASVNDAMGATDPLGGEVLGEDVPWILTGVNAHKRGYSRIMRQVPSVLAHGLTLAGQTRAIIGGATANDNKYTVPWNGLNAVGVG